eukprot:366107-Chlamydomonas_euryale.AAC.6
MSDGGGGLGGGLHGSSVGLPKRRRGRVEPRHIIVLACFLATLVMYMERVGFSIAFTELAKSAELDESMKGTVLSAFFWGYALSQARRVGWVQAACVPACCHGGVHACARVCGHACWQTSTCACTHACNNGSMHPCDMQSRL